MSAPRSKVVSVGGREFTVRPLIWRVAEEIRSMPASGAQGSTPEVCARILQRMAPDVTAEWLANNADTVEMLDVVRALNEVSGGPTTQGEAPAP